MKGFSFGFKKVEEKRKILNVQPKEDDKSEKITSFDAAVLEKPVNAPVLDIGHWIHKGPLKGGESIEGGIEGGATSSSTSGCANGTANGTGSKKSATSAAVTTHAVTSRIVTDLDGKVIVQREQVSGGLQGGIKETTATVDPLTQTSSYKEALASILAEVGDQGKNADKNADEASKPALEMSFGFNMANGAAVSSTADRGGSTAGADGAADGPGGATAGTLHSGGATSSTAGGGKGKPVNDARARKIAELFKHKKKDTAGAARITALGRDEVVPDTDASQFDSVHIEDFGMAYLRGLGYDPKQHKVEEAKRSTVKLAPVQTELPSDKMAKDKAKKAEEEKRKAEEAKKKLEGSSPNLLLEDATKKNERERTPRRDESSNTWMRPGLVVKIVDKRHDAYCKKAVIKSVDTNADGKPVCNVETTGKGLKYSAILEKHVETTISEDSEEVKLLKTHETVKVVKGSIDKRKEKLKIIDAKSREETKVTFDQVCVFQSR